MIVGCGTIFAIEAGKKRTLYSFQGKPDGAYPTSLFDVNGTIYGTTIIGGETNHGTIFDATATGKTRVIYSFKGHANGDGPVESLIPAGGTLYGATAGGGDSRCYLGFDFGACGTVFAFQPP